MTKPLSVGLIVVVLLLLAVGLRWLSSQAPAPEPLAAPEEIAVEDIMGEEFIGDEPVSLEGDAIDTLEEFPSPTPTPIPDGVVEGVTDPEPGAVKEFTVTGSSFKFDLSEIRVNQGDTVRITYTNGGGFHDFKLDEFSVATQVLQQAGQQEVVEFVADQVGTFEYYCSVGNHRQMGMKGSLIVE